MFGFRSDVIIEYWPLFVNGAFMTVKITVICVLLGMILGTLLGMGRLASARHEPLKGLLHYGVRWPVAVYVSFFRGTPLFVQLFLMHRHRLSTRLSFLRNNGVKQPYKL